MPAVPTSAELAALAGEGAVPDLAQRVPHLDERLVAGRVLVFSYLGLIAVTGSGFALIHFLQGAYGLVVLALVVTLVGLAVGGVGWCVLRMVRLLAETADRVDRVRYRLDVLESALELRDAAYAGDAATDTVPAARSADPGVPVESPDTALADRPDVPPAIAVPSPATGGAGDAGDIEVAFCAAIDRRDLRTCRRLWPTLAADLTPQRRDQLHGLLRELDDRTARELRLRFRAEIRGHAFDAALQTGEALVELFPHRQMARDFLDLRATLKARVNGPARAAAEGPSVPPGI